MEKKRGGKSRGKRKRKLKSVSSGLRFSYNNEEGREKEEDRAGKIDPRLVKSYNR